MSTKTRRRLVPATALLALALVAAILAWPSTTVASGGGISPCHEACSNAALACNIDCWERYRWEPNLVFACQLACENALDPCIAACP
ncbi:MAG: hypothetical protein AAGC60_26405 [Acidobacteriota bacterium]